MANDFDEAAAINGYVNVNKQTETEWLLDRDVWLAACRYQHSLMQERLAALTKDWQHEHTRKVDLEHDNERLSATCERMREALVDLKAAIGDRLLAQGPLSKKYAHSIMNGIDKALESGERNGD